MVSFANLGFVSSMYSRAVSSKETLLGLVWSVTMLKFQLPDLNSSTKGPRSMALDAII